MTTRLLPLSLVLLVGCHLAPDLEEWNQADFGPPPGNQEALIAQYFELVLFDPGSLRLSNMNVPSKAWYHPGALSGTTYGWGSVGFVNTKNRFGGYTGAKPFEFFFSNGTCVYAGDLSEGNTRYVGFAPE
jgi:hypothetical protein